MKTSNIGIDFLMSLEGFKNKAYKDTKGLWTIGVGHLILSNEKHLLTATLTNLEVNLLLSKDLVKYETTVNHVIHNDITQYQFDALVSFCFNIGCSGFANSTVAKVINAGKFDKVADAMRMWNKPKEIIGRREKEVRLFTTAKYK